MNVPMEANTGPEPLMRLNELEQLVSVAEEVAKRIDDYVAITAKLKSNFLYQTMAVYGIAILLIFALKFAQDMAFDARYVVFAVAISIFLLGGAFLSMIVNNRRRVRQLNRELAVEYQIQSRLISLIDDQLKRVADDTSPVHLALFEIRVRRLERQAVSNKLFPNI